VFLFGEHIRTGAWDLAGEALALAVVTAGAAALSRSLGEDGYQSCEHKPTLISAASSVSATRPRAHPNDLPVTGSCRTRRPRALGPDVAVPADRTLPGPAPAAAARAGAPRLVRGNEDLDSGWNAA
jgi:hypothetical protein